MEYKCQHCGAAYQVAEPGYYKCAQCGEAFTVDAPANITPAAQCPMCKGVIPPDAKKCQHCGSWVKQKQPSVLVYVLLWLFIPAAVLGVPEFYAKRKMQGFLFLSISIYFYLAIVVFKQSPAIFGFYVIAYFICFIFGVFQFKSES